MVFPSSPSTAQSETGTGGHGAGVRGRGALSGPSLPSPLAASCGCLLEGSRRSQSGDVPPVEQ